MVSGQIFLGLDLEALSFMDHRSEHRDLLPGIRDLDRRVRSRFEPATPGLGPDVLRVLIDGDD